MGAAVFGSETATLLTMNVAYQSNRAGDVTLVGGTGLSWTTLAMTGGSVTLQSGGTTGTQSGGTLRQTAGNVTTLTVSDDKGSSPTYIHDGTGTLAAVIGRGPVTFDLSQSQQALTITNLDLFGKVTWRDPHRRVTYTNGLDLHSGLANDDSPSIQLGRSFRITPGSVT